MGSRMLVSLGANILNGLGSDDTFVFHRGQANGSTVTDFSGNGANPGDSFQFVGYDTAAQGATFTNIIGNQWQIHAADNSVNDIITLANGATVDQSDVLFL
jgi:hypothetical protein